MRARPALYMGPMTFVWLLVLGFTTSLSAEPGWQKEWEKIVAAANQEGKVVIYSGSSDIALLFEKLYPKVKVMTATDASGGLLSARIMTERRAGKYLADLYMAGPDTHVTVLYPAKALDPISPALILPEVTDVRNWWERKHHYADPEDRYTFLYNGAVSNPIHYNTKLVDPKEITSYWDLLKPKWKGRIEARDPTGTAHSRNNFFSVYSSQLLGPLFLRRFFLETALVLGRDNRQLVDWLSAGKYALCFACGGVSTAREQGLPVNTISSIKEGSHLVTSGGTISLINKAPHPNAAKVFINWFLSLEGQIALQKLNVGTGTHDSLRIDIPKDDVPLEIRRQEGVKYSLTVKDRIPRTDELLRFVNELLAERERKSKDQKGAGSSVKSLSRNGRHLRSYP